MLKIGVDIFYKNIFTWFSWSADFLETSEETKFVLSNLNVAGKRIVDIRTVGGGWDTRTRVRPPGRIYGLIDFEEELLYKCAISLSDKERNGVDLSLWFDLRFSHLREARINEPFIIVFEDGDRLEILCTSCHCVRLSKNCIPANIDSQEASPNMSFNAKELFSPCIGETLLGFEVHETVEIPNSTKAHYRSEGRNQEKGLSFLLSGGKKLLFRFRESPNYGMFVTAVDTNGKALEVPPGGMKNIVHAIAALEAIKDSPVQVKFDTRFLKNFGLIHLAEENNRLNLIEHILPVTKFFDGHQCYYMYKNLNDLEIIATTVDKQGDGDRRIIGFNFHKMGNCFWTLKIAPPGIFGMDGANPYAFKAFFQNPNSSGAVPVNLVLADVLSSYLEGDVVTMQVVAFPVAIDYYADTHNETCYVYPISLPGEDGDLVLLKGRVLSTDKRKIKIDNRKADFLDVTVDTPYGPIELVHTIDFVKEAQRCLIKPGGFVETTCVLSGDVAVEN